MKIEIGKPNTRSAGMVREEGSDWRYPTIEDKLVMLEERVTELESYMDAARTRIRVGAQ